MNFVSGSSFSVKKSRVEQTSAESLIKYHTVFPRIVVHAPICIRNRGNGEYKVHFFLPQKNRALSYISACHCRDLKISLPIWIKNGQFNALNMHF